jgi:PAS domain S-box-containing protein
VAWREQSRQHSGVLIGQADIENRSRDVVRDVALPLAVAAVYFGAAKLGLTLAFSNRSVTAVWPPSGLALATVVLFGRRIWPGIALGAFLANLTTQGSLLTVMAITAGNTLEALVGAYLLARVGFRRDLNRLRDVGALVLLAGALSTLVAATIGVASLAADGLVRHGAFLSTWRVWWLGDFGGDLLIASTIFALTSKLSVPRRRLWRIEALAAAVALIAVSAYVFSAARVGAYATLPLLFWIALRFGAPGAVVGGLLVSGYAVWFTKHMQGPFVGGTLDSALLRAQTFVGIATVTALCISAVRSEQRSSEESAARVRQLLRAQRRQADELREAEERFRGAFEHAAIGMALVAPDGHWLRVNRALCEIVGYSEQELLERSFQDLTHPDDLATDLRRMNQMLSGEIRTYQLDKRYIHRDGHVVWVTLSASLVHDASHEPLYFVSQTEDITERKRSQSALQAALQIARAVGGETDPARVLEVIAERSRSLVEASSLAILLAEGDELVVAAAHGSLERHLIGRRVAARGTIAEKVLTTGTVARVDEVSEWPRSALTALGVNATSALVVPLAFRGTRFGVIEAIDRIAGPEFREDDDPLLLAAAASASTAIATARSVERERVRRSLRAAEDERRRWARELHDETLQALGGLRVMLSSAYRSGDEQTLSRAAHNALEHLDTEIESLRVLISELRPAALDELGLDAALVALAERAGTTYGIDVRTTIEKLSWKASQLDPELETVVYRVVQEAVTNAARHANPDVVEVSLSRVDGEIWVSVADDGDGFDVSTPHDGFGLAGMRERVSLVGGRLELESSPDGTTVTVALPVSAERAVGSLTE